MNFIPVTVNLTFDNVDLNKIVYAQKIRNLSNIGVLFDRLPVTTVFFFRLCGDDLCITRKWGKKVFRVPGSGFRIQLDGMEACNKIAVKWDGLEGIGPCLAIKSGQTIEPMQPSVYRKLT